jgi:hypothetical protein
MVPCSAKALHCILPLSVAFNSVGKRRLIWDGCHVNAYLPHKRFRMETLQREGRTLFSEAGWGGTADISSAYHHLPMHEDSTRFLGFEWDEQHFYFAVLPFGLSTAPWVFTREARSAAQLMLHALPRFGWSIHPPSARDSRWPSRASLRWGPLLAWRPRPFRSRRPTRPGSPGPGPTSLGPPERPPAGPWPGSKASWVPRGCLREPPRGYGLGPWPPP